MSRRTRYQQGSAQREERLSGSDVWIYRWYETGTDGTSKYRKVIAGTVATLANEASALKPPKHCASTQTNKPRTRKAVREPLPN